MIRTFKIVFEQPSNGINVDYKRSLHGFMCNLCGDNNYGSNNSKYSYTGLRGGTIINNEIKFKNSPYILIRIGSSEVFNSFINQLPNMTKSLMGLKIIGIVEVFVDMNRTLFKTQPDTPLRLGKKFENIHRKLNHDEKENAEQYLINQVKQRAIADNVIIDENLSIKIVNEYKPVIVNYRGIYSNSRVFDLNINCDSLTKEYILLHGLGKSNASGFGFIY